MAIGNLQGTSKLAQKSGLLFQRNMVASLSDFGTQLSKDFEAQTGIPTKCEFVTRAMSEVKIRFRPKTKFKKGGEVIFKQQLKDYLKRNMMTIDRYLNDAIRKTLGPSSLVEINMVDKEGRSETSQWMGGTRVGSSKS